MLRFLMLHLLPALLLLRLPQLAIAIDANISIKYPWGQGPFGQTEGDGHYIVTWGVNDCVNISWTTAPPFAFQFFHIECNPSSSFTPWTRVWAFNSSDKSGYATSLFCVANANPPPPKSNKCRFVLDSSSSSDAPTVDTRYSQAFSLRLAGGITGERTTYPLPQWTATSTDTTSTDTSKTAMSTITSGGISTAQASSTSPAVVPDAGLSVGAKAGIGVGAALVGIIILSWLGIALWRRKRQRRAPGVSDPAELPEQSKH